MTTKLMRLAGKHDLDRTVYVRWTEDPGDDSQVVATACDLPGKALGADEEEAVVGVYALVGITKVKRINTVTLERLA